MTGDLGLQQPPPFFARALFDEIGDDLKDFGYSFEGFQLYTEHGFFRFYKQIGQELRVYVIFQVLVYLGGPPRFRVNLMRRRTVEGHSSYMEEEISLSRLVWDIYSVEQLGRPDHWWTFTGESDLIGALRGAWRLLFEYGIPWLEGRHKAKTAGK